ncbi:caspase family protein [Mucilaginibacter antarcticus]|uniref:caspase family protein n=1 Tax=Mucilaginibacter antarcticus TaxID=1855725 RepID=UPI0036407C94
MTKKVTAKDNLLIFYAGHGNWDEARMQGYWYPADAKLNRRDTWVTNDDLIGFIRGIKSKHTLLVTDACFAGSIFKTRGIEAAPKGIQELYNTPSRKAMTSGSMKEVPDKSVFIEYLVKRLKENTDKYLPSDQLYTSFRIAVTNNSENGQMPQFGVITQTGDEGGDFIFIKK